MRREKTTDVASKSAKHTAADLPVPEQAAKYLCLQFELTCRATKI